MLDDDMMLIMEDLSSNLFKLKKLLLEKGLEDAAATEMVSKICEMAVERDLVNQMDW